MQIHGLNARGSAYDKSPEESQISEKTEDIIRILCAESQFLKDKGIHALRHLLIHGLNGYDRDRNTIITPSELLDLLP